MSANLDDAEVADLPAGVRLSNNGIVLAVPKGGAMSIPSRLKAFVLALRTARQSIKRVASEDEGYQVIELAYGLYVRFARPKFEIRN